MGKGRRDVLQSNRTSSWSCGRRESANQHRSARPSLRAATSEPRWINWVKYLGWEFDLGQRAPECTDAPFCSAANSAAARIFI